MASRMEVRFINESDFLSGSCAESLNFLLIKLVKAQSLILRSNLLRQLFLKNIKYSPTICCVSYCADN